MNFLKQMFGQNTTCLAFTAIFAFVFSACGDDGPTGPGPDPGPTPNKPPTAEITSPTEGSELNEGETITFEGSADDPEDGALTGNSLVWSSSLDGQIGTGEAFTSSDLSVGSHTVTLTATDSDGAKDAESVNVAVVSVNQPPTAEITSPTEGSELNEGETITFEGSADDPEDGALTGNSLVWSSSLDGQIGTGEAFTSSDLSVGSHTVTLTATDSDGAKDAETVNITVQEEVLAPTVELGGKLDLPDLDFAESVEIADGEVVVLSWSTENNPATCNASGGWGGTRSTSGGVVVTDGLSGPAVVEFVLECENSAGSSTDTVKVDVGAPGERHATTNRPDATTREQVKLFYVVDANGRNRKLDLNNTLENTFRDFQDRFESQVGRRFRMDSYEGRYDITFVAVDFADWPGLSVSDAIRKEMQKRGVYNRLNEGGYKTLLIHYDGEFENTTKCGGGWANEAYVWLDNCALEHSTQGHEVVHSLYMVDSDAPNAAPGGHTNDDSRDLMAPSASDNFLVDPGKDDYYNENGLPSNIKNLAESPFLIGN